MKLYLIIIGIANVVIALINISFYDSFFTALAFSLISTVTVIAVDGLTAFLIRRLPEKYFSADSEFFDVTLKERNFYKKLKIKNWKDKIPELGGFTGLHKNKVNSKNDAKYLAKFLMESNYGVIIHIVNAIFGFLIIILPFRFSVTIPVASVNAVLTFLPTLVLRYNTPTLKFLYLKAKNKAV